MTDERLYTREQAIVYVIDIIKCARCDVVLTPTYPELAA